MGKMCRVGPRPKGLSGLKAETLTIAYSPREPMPGGAVQGPWLELEVPSMGPNLEL